MKKLCVALVLVVGVLGLALHSAAEGPVTVEPGAGCDVKNTRLGWHCADCNAYKEENGDCCDPCACKGCADNKRVAIVQVCVKDLYVCENGCPKSESPEAGSCAKCGQERAKKSSQARVAHVCPKCGDKAFATLHFKCPKCNAEAKANECETCKVKNVPEFVAPGQCGKCKVDRVITCENSGTDPHTGGNAPLMGAAAGAGKETPKKEEGGK